MKIFSKKSFALPRSSSLFSKAFKQYLQLKNCLGFRGDFPKADISRSVKSDSDTAK